MRLSSFTAVTSILGLGFALALAPASVQAAELQVIAGGATTASMKEISTQFEKATGHKLVIRFGTTPELIKMANEGGPFDVGLVPREVFKDAAALAKFANGSVDIVRAGLGLAVRAGAPKPDISTPEALKQALLKAQSIGAIPESAAGYQITAAFERMGITDAVKSKIKVQKGPGQLVQALAGGEVEVGVFLSNAMTAPGVDVVGPFPGDLQKEVFFMAAPAVNTKQAEAAGALVQYLKSPEAVAVFKAKGMTPN